MSVPVSLVVAAFWTVVLALYLAFFFGIASNRPQAAETTR